MALNPALDLENRKPIWQALSVLYLDNEPTNRDIEWIASICAASPYSPEDIDRIMFSEVYPALIVNLFSVTGEWAGFESDWLVDRILKTYRRRMPIPWWISPVKRFYFGSVWRLIEKRISEKRNGGET